MKHLKIIKGDCEDWYGYSQHVVNEVAINIQLIWEEYQNEDDFIKEFAVSYSHELLHNLISEELWKLRVVREEEIVRILNGEEFTEDQREMYYVQSK